MVIIDNNLKSQTLPSEIKDKESFRKLKLFLGTGDYKYIRTPVRKEIQVGRNEICPCGSKKKYKKCCMLKS